MLSDLATRIADARKAIDDSLSQWTSGLPISRSLFIAMADEIARLTTERDSARVKINELYSERDAASAQVEKAREALGPMVDALSKCLPGWEDHVWVDDNHAINMGHLRTAARVHAELAEKEKE